MSWTTPRLTAAGSGWSRSPETGATPGRGQGQNQAPGQGPGARGGPLAEAGARVGLGAKTRRTDLAVRARSHLAGPDPGHERGQRF